MSAMMALSANRSPRNPSRANSAGASSEASPGTLSLQSPQHPECLACAHNGCTGLRARHRSVVKQWRADGTPLCTTKASSPDWPFQLIDSSLRKLVRLEGETSNTLLNTLEDWSSYLKAERVDFSKITQKVENDKPKRDEYVVAIGSKPHSRPPRRRQRGPSL